MNRQAHTHVRQSASAALLGALLFVPLACQRHEPGTYATPEEAVAALEGLLGKNDDRAIEGVFGPGSVDVFRSGDATQDRRAAQRVKQMIAERVAFDEFDENTRVAQFGAAAWPFPIPLVRAGERWKWDTAAGREELLNRRIGYNELSTLTTLHEYVEAQREYAAEGRDENPPAYAQKVHSSEGKHDGLFWPSVEGQPKSPLGDLFAGAAPEYQTAAQGPRPLRGYHYRILTAQGPNAPGGARSYVDARGRMTGGFAAVAWPANHGNSGVMTFLVDRRGVVYQKDLGAGTAELAAAITLFDPDDSWMPTGDGLDLVDEAAAAEPAADEAAGAEGS